MALVTEPVLRFYASSQVKQTCKILNNKTEILSLVNVNSKTMMSWDGADWKKDAFFNGNILHLKVLKPFFNHVKRVLYWIFDQSM